VNLLREPGANSHRRSIHGTRPLGCRPGTAARRGVPLKPVIDEKNGWIGTIAASRNMTSSASGDNFCHGGRKVRWLEEAWWVCRRPLGYSARFIPSVRNGDPTANPLRRRQCRKTTFARTIPLATW
jgi:hypothetical protein